MFSLGIGEVLFVERRQEECFFALLTRWGVWQIKHLKISASSFGEVDMIRHFSSLSIMAIEYSISLCQNVIKNLQEERLEEEKSV